jgi:hypothetical protein
MYAFLFLITAVLITIVTGNVFPHSQKGYVFLFFWQFGLCVFAFGYSTPPPDLPPLCVCCNL